MLLSTGWYIKGTVGWFWKYNHCLSFVEIDTSWYFEISTKALHKCSDWATKSNISRCLTTQKSTIFLQNWPNKKTSRVSVLFTHEQRVCCVWRKLVKYVSKQNECASNDIATTRRTHKLVQNNRICRVKTHHVMVTWQHVSVQRRVITFFSMGVTSAILVSSYWDS